MNKLTYLENIGFIANCPKIEKTFKTKAELFEEYEKFKVTWMEISRIDPFRNKITEKGENGYKIMALTTLVKSETIVSSTLTWVKSVEIEFDEV